MKTRLMNTEIALFLFRTGLGVNMFMHGIVRLGENAPKFIDHMTGMCNHTIIPVQLVKCFAYWIIPLEIIIGACLLAGVFTLQANMLVAMLIMIFMFGACLVQKWGLVGSQLVYLIAFFLLIFFNEYNRFYIDTIMKRKGRIWKCTVYSS